MTLPRARLMPAMRNTEAGIRRKNPGFGYRRVLTIRELLHEQEPPPEQPAPAIISTISLSSQFEKFHKLADSGYGTVKLADARYKGEPGEPTLADIQNIIFALYGIRRTDIISSRRSRETIIPRHHFCWLARYYTSRSLNQIAKFLRLNDHTTVLNAVASHQKRMDSEGIDEWKAIIW